MLDSIKNVTTQNNLKQTDSKSKGSSNTAKSANITSSSQVLISEKAKQLNSISKSILSMPETNESKVAEIKQAIANGEYKINPENIAKKMIRDLR